MIETIMLFAAGLGNRMRHLTQNNPKTLINVLDRPILYYALELCKSYPFKKIVINTHYMHQKIENAIQEFLLTNPGFPSIEIIYEEELLETGGAVKNAINSLGEKPIFALNTDVILFSQSNIFTYMLAKWDPENIDFLLLMQEYDKAIGYKGHGDFDLADNGALLRQDKEENYDFIYAGLQILKPSLVAKHPLKIFSLREYYLNSPRVFGIKSPEHTSWYHATSPEDLVTIELDLLSTHRLMG